jgi:predicted metal-binding membrane protein
MGLDLAAFLGAWTLMMGAMMIPSIAPLTSLYSRTFGDHRARRLALLTAGYLTVWASAGLLAFPLAAGADRLARRAPGWAEAVAIGSCVACAAYQLSPLKERCLRHCRSPLGYLMRYTSWRGPLVDGRVGLEHGAWCLACCWSLMVLLVTFGVMNLVAMVGLAAVIVTEKVLVPGRWFSISVGVVAVGLAIAVGIHPSLAAGLHEAPTMSRM